MGGVILKSNHVCDDFKRFDFLSTQPTVTSNDNGGLGLAFYAVPDLRGLRKDRVRQGPVCEGMGYERWMLEASISSHKSGSFGTWRS